MPPQGSLEPGGRSAFNAARTVFRATPSRRAISLMGTPSARCRRRISAQSSTFSTLQMIKGGSILRDHLGVSLTRAATPAGRFASQNSGLASPQIRKSRTLMRLIGPQERLRSVAASR
ncbi:hypothetical protein ABH937_006355 [Kitasatospora sp. GAS1066B]